MATSATSRSGALRRVPRGDFLGDETLARERLEAYADAGVTTVRDVGGRSEVTLHLANRLPPGLPAVLATGRFLAPDGRYFSGMHEPVAAGDLLAAASREIALLARHGLTPEQALAAGSTAAAWLHPSRPVADSLVTYEADPRDDPEVLVAPAAVVVRGQRVR